MTKREAVHRPAALWEAARKEPVYILENGEPAFRLEAIRDGDDPLAELRAAGLISPAKVRGPLSEPLRSPDLPAEEGETLYDAFMAEREAGR